MFFKAVSVVKLVEVTAILYPSGVARNLFWGVQLNIFGQKAPQILSFCELKAKTKFYLK